MMFTAVLRRSKEARRARRIARLQDVSNRVHGEGTYTVERYVPGDGDMYLRHNACGTVFKQRLRDHRMGHGCDQCAERGTQYDTLPGWLYYVRIELQGTRYWKIGITKHADLRDRFPAREFKHITVLALVTYPTLRQAYEREQSLFARFAQYRCQDPPEGLRRGFTELFDKDVLVLDRAHE